MPATSGRHSGCLELSLCFRFTEPSPNRMESNLMNGNPLASPGFALIFCPSPSKWGRCVIFSLLLHHQSLLCFLPAHQPDSLACCPYWEPWSSSWSINMLQIDRSMQLPWFANHSHGWNTLLFLFFKLLGFVSHHHHSPPSVKGNVLSVFLAHLSPIQPELSQEHPIYRLTWRCFFVTDRDPQTKKIFCHQVQKCPQSSKVGEIRRKLGGNGKKKEEEAETCPICIPGFPCIWSITTWLLGYIGWYVSLCFKKSELGLFQL